MSISLKPISVLYIHHSGVFGGAQRSLLELVKALSNNSIDPIVFIPRGITSKIFTEANIKTFTAKGISQFDNSKYGHYRNFRWLILFRELLYIPFTYFGLKRLKKQINSIDIIHVNEITCLPAAIMAKRIFKVPVVLHVRSLQRSPGSYRNKLIYRWISKHCSKVIAIDHTVNSSLPHYLNPIVIHNGFKPQSSNLNESRNSKPVFAMVCSLNYFKGVVDFIKAAVLAQENNLDITFRIIGTELKKLSKFEKLLQIFNLSHNASDEISTIIEEKQLTNIEFRKFTMDISSAYSNIDVLCFPSHLNAAGRPVFEAAFFKKPCIIAIENPQSDTVMDYKTGICVPVKSPQEIFNAIKYFCDNPEEITRMGSLAYELANKNFDIKRNAAMVRDVYSTILDKL